METERGELASGSRESTGGQPMTQHTREALYASISGVATLLVMVSSTDAFTGRSAASSLQATMEAKPVRAEPDGVPQGSRC